MRLYVSNINIKNLNLKNISNYKNLSKKKYMIISDKNLLIIKKDKIYNLKQIDNEIIKIKINKYDIIIDYSYFKEDRIVNQIPFNHYILEFLIEEYVINKLDDIKLCVEYIKEENTFILNDFYFKIDNKLIDPKDLNKFNIEIIDTFLLLLTNVN